MNIDMNRLCRAGALAAALGVAASISFAQAPSTLTLPQARRVVEAAVAEARRLGAPGAAVAVVDGGGFPVAVERLDCTFVAGTTISIGKARTAAIFGRPTKVLENAINNGRDAMLALTTTVGATPMQGGVPLVVGGQVLGAVGVSAPRRPIRTARSRRPPPARSRIRRRSPPRRSSISR